MEPALSEAANVSEAELLRKIQTADEYIHTHPEDLGSHIYNAIDGISKTYLAYKNAKGAKGWASSLVNQDGKSMWSPEQASQLEEKMPQVVSQVDKAFEEKPLQQEQQEQQVGGVSSLPPLHVTAESSLVTLPVASTFSLDDMFYSVRSYLKSLDDKNREIAAVVGPVALVRDYTDNFQKDPQIFSGSPQYGIPPIKIPARLIIPAISTVLETCRTIVSNSYVDNASLRKLFSIVLAVFDVSRGEWKQGVFNLLGYFGKDYMEFGKSLSMYRWVYNFISPDIQERLEEDIYAASKSLLVGAILWTVSVVSPESVRNTINGMLESSKKTWDELNTMKAGIEARAQESAAKVGASVTFPAFPLKQFPSFDDIQNFQSIVHQPEVLCSKDFQESLTLAIQIPALRFVLELMNVPTVPEAVQEICKDQPSTVTEALVESMTPIVTMEPIKKQKGGRNNNRRLKLIR